MVNIPFGPRSSLEKPRGLPVPRPSPAGRASNRLLPAVSAATAELACSAVTQSAAAAAPSLLLQAASPFSNVWLGAVSSLRRQSVRQSVRPLARSRLRRRPCRQGGHRAGFWPRTLRPLLSARPLPSRPSSSRRRVLLFPLLFAAFCPFSPNIPALPL